MLYYLILSLLGLCTTLQATNDLYFALTGWLPISIAIFAIILLTQGFIFHTLMPQINLKRIILAIITANLIASIAVALIPRTSSEYLTQFAASSNTLKHMLSWLYFFLINLLVKVPIFKLFFREISFKQISITTILANIASDIALATFTLLLTGIMSGIKRFN